jgi:hypothetical protein
MLRIPRVTVDVVVARMPPHRNTLMNGLCSGQEEMEILDKGRVSSWANREDS